MANKVPTIKQRQEYVVFLQKRIDSKNYKNKVSEEEYKKNKRKA